MEFLNNNLLQKILILTWATVIFSLFACGQDTNSRNEIDVIETPIRNDDRKASNPCAQLGAEEPTSLEMRRKARRLLWRCRLESDLKPKPKQYQ